MSNTDVLVEPGLQTPEPSLEEMLKELNDNVDKDGIVFIPPKLEKQSAPEVAEPVKTGKWNRTRYCACPPSAPTDCRFHSIKEKGWEVCPSLPLNWEKTGKPEVRHGKWLNSSS